MHLRPSVILVGALLLVSMLAPSAQAGQTSEWDDGSIEVVELAAFGPDQAAELKLELERQLREIRQIRGLLEAPGPGTAARVDEHARELLRSEAWLLVASEGLDEVADGHLRDPAEIAERIEQALAASAAALLAEANV
jgi:hypothetical protein